MSFIKEDLDCLKACDDCGMSHSDIEFLYQQLKFEDAFELYGDGEHTLKFQFKILLVLILFH